MKEENLRIIENLVYLIEQEKFRVDVYKKYGRYFIEFETTGLQIREIKRFIEYLPLSAIITSSNNRCLCIDTNINIK